MHHELIIHASKVYHKVSMRSKQEVCQQEQWLLDQHEHSILFFWQDFRITPLLGHSPPCLLLLKVANGLRKIPMEYLLSSAIR
jgi:hypothetical protein